MTRKSPYEQECLREAVRVCKYSARKHPALSGATTGLRDDCSASCRHSSTPPKACFPIETRQRAFEDMSYAHDMSHS
jgi:hypothetical protein